MKKTLSLLLALTMIFSLCACGTSGTTQSDSAKGDTDSGTTDKFYIGVCGRDFTSPFQTAMYAKMEELVKAYPDIDLDVRDGEGDPNVQVNIIQNFIEQKKDLIIVIANQEETLIGAVASAVAAGIPVINTNCSIGKSDDILTFIGCDDEYGGYMQGQLVHNLLGKDEGNIVLLKGLLGTSYEVQRTTGIERYIAEVAPGIKIVAAEAEDNDNAKAVAAMQNLLTRFPAGEIDAVVVQGPTDAVAAADACIAAGREELKGKIVAFDYCTVVEEAIKDGRLYGTVDQNPMIYAEQTIELAVKLLHGEIVAEDVEPQYFIDLPTVTAANIEEYGAAPWA